MAVTRFGDFTEYQTWTERTAVYPPGSNLYYPVLGLAGEVGEVCEMTKKTMRDDHPMNTEDLELELGDVLWYLARVATEYGLDLGSIARKNVEKLESRLARDVIHGSGDHR